MSIDSEAVVEFEVAADLSSVCLVYPFVDTRTGPFSERVRAVNGARWAGEPHNRHAAPVWLPQTFGDVEDLLPYVANYLKPAPDLDAAARTPHVAGSPSTAQFWTLNVQGHHGDQEGSGTALAGRLRTLRPGNPAPVTFELSVTEVQLALFGHGVGFLSLWLVPAGIVKLDDWLSFLYYCRTGRSRARAGWEIQLTLWRCATSAQDGAAPRPLYSVPACPEDDPRCLDFYVTRDALLQSVDPRPQGGDRSATVGPWWTDAYVRDQLIPYAILYVDTAPRIELPDVPTEALKRRLYQIRNFFSGDFGTLAPREELEVPHPALLPYARHMWFTFSLTGTAFVAFNAPRQSVFTETLRQRSLPGAYFLLFLLALQQRFVLTMLSDAVAQRWLPARHAEERAAQTRRWWRSSANRPDQVTEDMRAAFDDILDAFLAFTARGYFAQVMQGERHHTYYRKWQETFQVAQLYAEVRDEVTQMRNHLELHATRQLNEAVQILRTVSLILATIGTIGAWWALNVQAMKEQGSPLAWPVDVLLLNAILAVVVLGALAYFRQKGWIRRRRRR